MELFSQDQSLGVFDVVVLAAPIHECRIEFLVQSQKDDVVLQPMPFHRVNVEDHQPEDGEPPVLAKALPEYATRPYTQVVTTIVSGAVLNASYFSLSDSDVPRSIYMTERGKELEENITAISQITTKSSAYKVFSNDVLSDVALKNIFGEKYTVEVVKVWGGPYGGATPDYQGSGRTINYQLYDGSGGNSHGSAVLYYSNAIEGSMACIELSAIGAKSVAKLVAKRLGLVVPHNGTGIHSDEL
jgi:prenylcysteine oxidase/farnesylcysteine lyase